MRRLAQHGRRAAGRVRALAPYRPVPYWNERAQELGSVAVLNRSHGPEELGSVTRVQKQILFPHLREALRGDERRALDFGCGPGRFTGDLAEMVGGEAVGVDPIERLVELAPAAPGVEYRVMKEGEIPLPDDHVDVVWSCLVLGAITRDRALKRTLGEIERVLAPGGLLFLVESTGGLGARHFRVRPVDEYRSLVSFVDLECRGGYDDAGERISILAGRRA